MTIRHFKEENSPNSNSHSHHSHSSPLGDRKKQEGSPSNIHKQIMVVGGATSSKKKSASQSVLIYDIGLNTWIPLKKKVDMIKGHTIALPHGSIGLVGGETSEGEKLEIYDFDLLTQKVNFITNDSDFLEKSGYAGVQNEGKPHINIPFLLLPKIDLGFHPLMSNS